MSVPARATYRLLAGTHRRVEADGLAHLYSAGDSIEMTDIEAATHADRIAPTTAHDTEPAASQASLAPTPPPAPLTAPPAPTDWAPLLDSLAPEVVALVSGLEDTADLSALLVLEQADRNRKSVVAAITARFKEL